jgi:membrane protein required for colicin V production
MEDFTVVDAAALVIVAVSALLAFSRGFIREVLSILGWVAAAVIAFYFAPQAQPLIKEIPYVSGFIGDNCELAILAAFAVVFAFALILTSIFTPLLSGAVQNSALGPIDQGLGFLFGVARGVILIAIAFIVYDRVIAGSEGIAQVDGAKSKALIAQLQVKIEERLEQDQNTAVDWITGRFGALTADCSGNVEITPVTPETEAAPAEGAAT